MTSPPELAQLLALPDLAVRQAAVEARIASIVEPYRKVLGPVAHELVTAPGKRLRATLTIAFAQLGGRYDDVVVRSAAVVELVQLGSLIHDDIIDGAPTRRGKPTLNATLGPGPALVAGDLLLALAGQVAAELQGVAPALLAEGMAQMARGQLSELQDHGSLDRTVERHLDAVRGKTGALFACACRLGAASAALPPSVQNAAAEYGAAMGVAYQLVDDLLDVAGDPAVLGKPVGIDLASGTYTTPVLLALEARGGKRLGALLRRHPTDLAEALAVVRRSPAMRTAVAGIDEHLRTAEAAARRFPKSPISMGLRALPRTHALATLRTATDLDDRTLAPLSPDD